MIDLEDLIKFQANDLGNMAPLERMIKPTSPSFPIDEIPLFSNYSPCFHKIGYIQKIVYKKKLFS